MTDPTPLSPAAQAVMDACEWDGVGGSYKRAAAAALRAAAFQLMSAEAAYELNDIAAELEGAQ